MAAPLVYAHEKQASDFSATHFLLNQTSPKYHQAYQCNSSFSVNAYMSFTKALSACMWDPDPERNHCPCLVRRLTGQFMEGECCWWWECFVGRWVVAWRSWWKGKKEVGLRVGCRRLMGCRFGSFRCWSVSARLWGAPFAQNLEAASIRDCDGWWSPEKTPLLNSSSASIFRSALKMQNWTGWSNIFSRLCNL